MCVWEGDITFSPTVLPHIPWPHRDITVGKYKAGFHEAWAYLGSESMWDMPRNKRPSLSLGAGQGDLFQQPQIALCFLNWQTLATFDRNDMQLAGSPGLPGRPPFSRKIVLDLVHQNVWWRSLSLRHKHIVRWWVQLTVGCTCVGKVGYFRVWGRPFQSPQLHHKWWKMSATFISLQVFSSSSKTPTFRCLLLFYTWPIIFKTFILWPTFTLHPIPTCLLFNITRHFLPPLYMF